MTKTAFFPLAFALLAIPLPAAAATAPNGDEQIVIIGVRDGSKVLEVDFDRVWKQCRECKRALAKLDELAKPYRQAKGRLSRDRNEYRVSASKENEGVPPEEWPDRYNGRIDPPSPMFAPNAATRDKGFRHARRIKSEDQFLVHQKQDLTKQRFHATALMAKFLNQRDPYVAAAAEQERVARGAAAILHAGKKYKSDVKYERIEATDAVIQRLDAMDFTIGLPSG